MGPFQRVSGELTGEGGHKRNVTFFFLKKKRWGCILKCRGEECVFGGKSIQNECSRSCMMLGKTVVPRGPQPGVH